MRFRHYENMGRFTIRFTILPALMWVLLILLSFILLSSAVFGVGVNREFPSRVKPGETFDATLRISGAVPSSLFTLEENRPPEVTIINWSIEGANESKDAIQTRDKDLGFGWSFTPTGTDASIHYTAKVSLQAHRTLLFEAVYFDPSGFNKLSGTLQVEGGEEQAPAQSPHVKPQASAPASAIPLPKKETEAPPSLQQNRLAGLHGGPSPLVGILLIVIIVVGGLGVFYYFTKPAKQETPFNDQFFKKKR